MFKGDEVDVFYQEKKESGSVGVWWHAVIIDDLPRSAKTCYVYWVGWEPCATGNKSKSRRPGEFYLNPTYVNRDDVRSHISGKCSAGSLAQHSVAWIKSKYCVVHISEEESDPKGQDQVPGPNVVPSGSAPAHSPLSSSHEAGPGALGISNRPKRLAAAGSTPPKPPVSVPISNKVSIRANASVSVYISLILLTQRGRVDSPASPGLPAKAPKPAANSQPKPVVAPTAPLARAPESGVNPAVPPPDESNVVTPAVPHLVTYHGDISL